MGMLKVDSRISTISIPLKTDFVTITIPNFCKKFVPNWVLFGQIFKNAPNFANWALWVWNGNPLIDIPKMMKKHPKATEHPGIPSTSENVESTCGSIFLHPVDIQWHQYFKPDALTVGW